MFQSARALQIVEFGKGGILQSIEQNDLTLGILHKLKQHVYPFFLGRNQGMIGEKIFDNLRRTFSFGKSVLQTAVKERQPNARFINAVKRQGEKKAIIELKF